MPDRRAADRLAHAPHGQPPLKPQPVGRGRPHGHRGLPSLAVRSCPIAFGFVLAISLAGFFIDLTMGSAWAFCQDIGRRYAAIVAGCMNMAAAWATCWRTG